MAEENEKAGPDKGRERGGGWIDRARKFLSEVRNEMGRVSWPNRREVWATTIVVIITSAVFGIYLFLVDLGLSRAIGWIYRRFA